VRHGEEAFPFGSASISLATIERHVDDRKVASKWLDLLPSRQLWHPPLGVVELGIIGCKGLLPMRAAGGKGCKKSCTSPAIVNIKKNIFS